MIAQLAVYEDTFLEVVTIHHLLLTCYQKCLSVFVKLNLNYTQIQ